MYFGLRLLSVVLVMLAIASCGGGGDSASPSPNNVVTPPPVTNTVSPVTLNSKQGQVLLGPVVDASIEIYDATDLEGPTLCAVSSSSIDAEVGPGVVDLTDCVFDDAKLYYFVVRGGEDIDVDDDGELDETPTPKIGALHAILNGAQINSGGWRVNILTELAYQDSLTSLIGNSSAETVSASLDSSAKKLLKLDLNNDNIIDGADLAHFIPQDHFSSLANPDSDLINALLTSIHEGDSVDTTELSRQYLLGATGQFFFSNQEEDFFNVDFLSSEGLLYMAGALRDNSSAFIEDHIAIRIFDPTDPSAVVLAGSLDITELETDIFIHGFQLKKSGDYLYLAAGLSGLIIIDVSDPSDPQHIATFDSGSVVDVVELGDSVAYIGNYFGGITVLDITDPESPTVTDSFTTSVFDMLYHDDRLYVYGSGLSILDVTEPSNILQLDQLGFPSGSESPFSRKGNFLFLGTTDGFQSIKVFDVSDESSILEVHNIQTSALVIDMLVEGDFLYATTFSDDNKYSLNTYQIDSLGNLELIDSRLALSASGKVATGAESIYLSSPEQLNIYTKNALNHGTKSLVNVSTPLDAKQVELVGDLAYVADGTSLRIYNVSDPESSVDELSSISVTDFIEDMTVSGDFVYLANTVDGLKIIDVSDPENPILAGMENSLNDTPEGGYVTNTVTVVGDFAYTTIDNLNKLIVHDVSDPSNPALIGSELAITETSHGLVVLSDFIYRVNSGALQVIDASDPHNLTSTQVTFIHGTDLVIENGIGYMSTLDGEIRVIDFSNANFPVQLSTALGLGQGTGIAVVGNIAYMSNAFGIINVFDVSNSAAPVYLSQYKVNGVVSDVAATEDYVFATNGFGLVVEHAIQSTSNID
ncbi:hypothetical protein N9J84_00700 [Porticoccaceae bacterium]|nr:hypothetical protein [Porticoccaceae bacterium]